MFKNEYQGGPYLEIFSPQGRDATSSHWKLGSGVKKVYEKEVKGYVYVLEGTPSTTKMHIPKDNKQSMTLVQRYLVLQVYIPKGQDWFLELGVCDLSNNKRRIQLSTAQKEMQATPLHARVPLCVVKRAVWLNLCLDMVSLVGETWSGQTYRAIDHITVSANCKVRRIFTMKSQPPDTTDDNELYGCHGNNQGEVDLIPKQVQLASDIPQYTQVLSVNKIKCAERVKYGRGLTLADQIRPGSMLDLDLNNSVNKGNFHIAFGSKVNKTSSETSRRSSRQGSTTSRSSRSTLSRADGGSMRDLRESVGSQDGLITARSGVKDTGQRLGKPSGASRSSSVGYARQVSEPVTHDEQETITVNGVNHSHIVTPHPPREPSNDRVRRYHRVKTVHSNPALNHSNSSPAVDTINTTKDRVSSAGSITEEPVTDSGIASKATSSTSSAAARSDQSAVTMSTDTRNGSGDALRRQAVGRNIGSVSTNHSQLFGQGRDTRDSLNDVIALLKGDDSPQRGDAPVQRGAGPAHRGAGLALRGEGATHRGEGPSHRGERPTLRGEGATHRGEGPSHRGEGPTLKGEGPSHRGEGPTLRGEGPQQRGEEAAGESSDSGTESSQPGEYEESDDEGSSDTTSKLHMFVSRPTLAPRRNVSPSTTDQEPSKRTGVKGARSNVRRSTSEILSSRGARPEDDFHTSMTSSDEDDAHQKPRPGQGSRPHSGTSTGSPKTRGANNPTERASLTKGRTATGAPKASISPDFKRPTFNPALYGGASSNHKAELPPRQTAVRRTRKSLREITPRLDESVRHSKASSKNYDHTKYQMADVTESYETRMLASMKREEEEELENVSPPPMGASDPLPPHPPRAGPMLRASQQVYSESPYTTSDDDTSFSTWKAPAPNQMAHNYQDEMKSRLSSDTLTSSNPRDWSSVFSPPIILPSERDLQGTLEGHFEDLNEVGSNARTNGPSTSEEDELDLMFDGNLNCYYDPTTLKYYELVS
ncbi:protein CFAP20DC-like [Littorina saxatilis]|uniref:CFA20 domain-containing protein n=1 Tax=Littorina saxatilis TaxID=31220 RepID=A0AAN9BB76_9CAEN